MFLSVLELYMQLKWVRTLKKEFPQSVSMPKNCSVPGCKILEAIRKSVKVSPFTSYPQMLIRRGTNGWSAYIWRSQWLYPHILVFVVYTLKIELPIMIYLHYSPGLLFLYVNPLLFALSFLRPFKLRSLAKDDNSSKQLQSYADQIINQVKRRLHLEQQLKTITEELEWMSWLCWTVWSAAISV